MVSKIGIIDVCNVKNRDNWFFGVFNRFLASPGPPKIEAKSLKFATQRQKMDVKKHMFFTIAFFSFLCRFRFQKWSPNRTLFGDCSKTSPLWKSLFFQRKIAIFDVSSLLMRIQNQCRTAFEKSFPKIRQKIDSEPHLDPPKPTKIYRKRTKNRKKNVLKKHVKKRLLKKSGQLGPENKL